MSWSFAIINGRLAEIFFDEMHGKIKRRRRIKISGHCYVKKEEYKTKKSEGGLLKTQRK